MKRCLVLLALTFLLVAGAGRVQAIQDGKQVPEQKGDLKPGEYVWEAGAADLGSLDIVVSLGKQLLWVYRDGKLIGRSTISSGSKGRETPKGVYMILEKNRTHHSNKYHEASMPYMERLTWGGLALHAGNTPGHPESHGCMHVPEDFAKDLFGYTQEGNTVLVADGTSTLQDTSDPDQLFAATPASGASPSPGETPAFTWKSNEVPNGPWLIVFSSADKHVYVYRKGVEVGRADLGGSGADHPLGEHVYAALKGEGGGDSPKWSLLGSGDGAPALDFKALAERSALPAEFQQKVRGIVAPGTTLVTTDTATNPAKPSGGDED